jgi:hypothetical protein
MAGLEIKYTGFTQQGQSERQKKQRLRVAKALFHYLLG